MSGKFSLLVLGVLFSIAAGRSGGECPGTEGGDSLSMTVPGYYREQDFGGGGKFCFVEVERESR